MASVALSADAPTDSSVEEAGSPPAIDGVSPHVQCIEIVSKDFEGVRVSGWQIQTRKRPILNMSDVERWEKLLETSHLPEMVFGGSSLELLHQATGIKIFFNALDALREWKQEKLPPVEVPAAAKWKSRSKPSQELMLDYDYTFTTPYCGSEAVEEPVGQLGTGEATEVLGQSFAVATKSLEWVGCKEHIDLVALQAKDPILFYDEVVLYEDELADNGISLVTVKVRVMPTCWFLLLRFWLRVDGSIMRLRDTRMFSAFQKDVKEVPLVIREHIQREETFHSLASKGYPSESSAYPEPSVACDRLSITKQKTEKLVLRNDTENVRSH
eukprot:TRINITY_DN5714_c0_g1_i1.p1 TRINITY_DN5714_c0_g1~~TRINITY_DN5714_c0_g1_i1.p1  ORF type:complete len:327 (+),score=52.02 TRINITY_DN5714_c0_g1_i1:133-1113(+)